MTNRDFIHSFFQDKTKRLDQHGLSRRHGNLIMNGRVLYSYGAHFPLAVETDEGDYILNGDTYSLVTSQHQTLTRGAAYNSNSKYVIIPFSVLRQANIDSEKITIIDQRNEQYRYKCKKTGKTYSSTNPEVLNNPNNYTEEHLLGGSVIEHHGVRQIKSRYFISSTDPSANWGHGYFLTELTHPVKTFEQALESLKPEKVKRVPDEKARRQGEYFFIQVGTMTEVKKMLAREDSNHALFPKVQYRFIARPINKHVYLPMQNGQAPHHKVRDLIELADGRLLVRGTVRHANHHHKMLNLGEHFYEAIHNTQVRSWGVNGRVD